MKTAEEILAKLETANVEASKALADFRAASEARRKLYADFATSLKAA